MFTGPVGPVKVCFYWTEAVFDFFTAFGSVVHHKCQLSPAMTNFFEFHGPIFGLLVITPVTS